MEISRPTQPALICLRWLLLGTVLSCTTVANAFGEDQPIAGSPALQEFLKRFDPIQQQGFIRTKRSGSTGIGYTLETLLGIRENNSPGGDLLGMEIKAYRDSEREFNDQGKMNLFLKEPAWIDGLTAAERVQKYGYQDDQQRQAWYQSVTVKPNERALRLQTDRQHQVVQLLHQEEILGQWTVEILKQRLQEKLSEIVFVAAATQGSGSAEEFHFRTVTYCAEPSVRKFLSLIESGDVILELRMHQTPTGGVRNHGTAFRLKKHRLKDLFGVQVLCR